MRQKSSVKRLAFCVIALCVSFGAFMSQQGYAQEASTACTLATLKGAYVFNATGYDIGSSGPAPKAIVESLIFKGDGTLTSLATVSLNGTIHSGIPGSGIYTVNSNCTGTLTFNGPGLTFDLFLASNGTRFHMIQTNPNTVLAGEVRRVPH